MESFFNGDTSSLTLWLKKPLEGKCDGSPIQPSRLGTMKLDEIGALKLSCDSSTVRLDEVFELIGDPSESLVIDGDCTNVTHLGMGLDKGSILVRGTAGNDVAHEMTGGRVEVLGDCGDRLATNMRNGLVVVHGSAGDCVAGPGVGQRRGMQGGDCIVLGNVGSRVAERMRRGMVFIGGDTGDFGAAQMIAGTVIVMGQLGSEWAGGMKRGSIILSSPTGEDFAAELTPCREFELSFLPLLWRHLKSLVDENKVKIPSSRWATRRIGDRANQGLGEVLTLTRHSH